MSVNLHLSLKISGYHANQAGAIKAAVADVFAREQLTDDMSPLTERSENEQPTLISRTNPDLPVIISKSYEWLPEMQAAFAAAVTQANGAPCEVAFEGEDADESDFEDDEEAQ